VKAPIANAAARLNKSFLIDNDSSLTLLLVVPGKTSRQNDKA
jgi:hypothetical protein